MMSIAGYSHAQSTTSPSMPPVTAASLGGGNSLIEDSTTAKVVTKTPTPLKQITDGVTEGYDQLKQLSFTNGFSGGPFGIRHNSDYGGGLFVRTANPTGVNVGFGLAAIYEKVTDPVTRKSKSELNLYDATVNISLNGTTAIPFVNWSVDYIIESGPAANLKDANTVYEQSLVGLEKTFKWGGVNPGDKAYALTIEVGEGHFSRWGNGFFQEIALAATYKPHGW